MALSYSAFNKIKQEFHKIKSLPISDMFKTVEHDFLSMLSRAANT